MLTILKGHRIRIVIRIPVLSITVWSRLAVEAALIHFSWPYFLFMKKFEDLKDRALCVNSGTHSRMWETSANGTKKIQTTTAVKYFL